MRRALAARAIVGLIVVGAIVGSGWFVKSSIPTSDPYATVVSIEPASTGPVMIRTVEGEVPCGAGASRVGVRVGAFDGVGGHVVHVVGCSQWFTVGGQVTADMSRRVWGGRGADVWGDGARVRSWDADNAIIGSFTTVDGLVLGESGDTRGMDVPHPDNGMGNPIPRRYDVKVNGRVGSFVTFNAYRIGASVEVLPPTNWDRLVVVDTVRPPSM